VDTSSGSQDEDFSTNSKSQSFDCLPLPIDVFQPAFPGLHVIHQNVQGLFSKMAEIAEWLHESIYQPLILCCTDTWLSHSDTIPSINRFGQYCFPPLPRPNKPGSLLPDSCMFVSSVLNPEHPSLCDEVEQMCTSLSVACCIVTCKHHRITVVSVYHSPSIPVAACIGELRSVLLQLSFNVHYILIAGNFNINLLSTNDASTKMLIY